MYSFYRLHLAFLLLLPASFSIAAPIAGWYAGFFAGASFIPNNNDFLFINPVHAGLVPVGNSLGKLDYGMMANGGLHVGYKQPYWRVEAEVMYNYNPYQRVHPNDDIFDDGTYAFYKNKNYTGPHVKGNTQFFAGFFNAYLELFAPTEARSFVPYLGIGIGYARAQNNLNLICDTTHTICNAKPPPAIHFNAVPKVTATNAVPLGQAIAGFTYWIDDFTSMGLDYRYMRSTNYHANFSNMNIPAENTMNIAAQTFNIVFNFSFDCGS